MDSIFVSVISNRLKAIGRQMGAVIERSAHSPLLVEGRDFSLGIYTADGVLIEQTEYIPILGYAAAPGVKAVVEYFKGDIREGDVFLHNDTFTGGNQNSDFKVLKPVFFDGQLFGWTVITAHQADVGGAVPGSYNPYATDLWQEGIRITPIRIFSNGKKVKDVWDLIIGNVRLPVVGDDILAMVGGCTVGEKELVKLLNQYGAKTVNEAISEIFDSTEKMAKQMIKQIPNGVYEGDWLVVDDGFNHEAEMKIKVKVTVEDEHMHFDFTGTSQQTKGYVNAPLPVTISSVMISFFMLTEKEIAHNEAIQRCISIYVPEGTMLNPVFPAASGFGNHLSDQICSAIFIALSKALPEQVTAGWNSLLCSILNGTDERTQKPFVDIMLISSKGGSGGTKGADGYDHIGLIASGGALAAQDPEMFELTLPLTLQKYEYATDSCGAGEWRGGLGVEVIFTINADGVQASVFGDGGNETTAAPGILGGTNGAVNYIQFEYPNQTMYNSYTKDLISNIPKGTIYKQLAGGGGGYGDPKKRPAELVAKEVRYGYISKEFAKDQYGVVISDVKKGEIAQLLR